MSFRNDFVENLKTFRSKERAEFEDARQREEREIAEAPIRAAQAEQNRLLVEIRDAEKQGIIAGRKDPAFIIPESVAGKRMSLDKAKDFAAKEATKFRESCEEFREKFNTPENRDAICNYLIVQEVAIPDVECFRLGFERLRDLGLLTEIPVQETFIPIVEPEQTADPEEERERKRQEYFTKPVVNFAGKGYSQAELDRLSSSEYRRVCGLYGERLPRFSNVIQA
jgi:hypothetical protein